MSLGHNSCFGLHVFLLHWAVGRDHHSSNFPCLQADILNICLEFASCLQPGNTGVVMQISPEMRPHLAAQPDCSLPLWAEKMRSDK
mmetsp:Transcript_6948/g.15000  ORF Transcript_6948/g.15000 Transcript_6948/m.15000 type:complete len:86 (+) Transcript_6948:100-357(+)